MDISFIADYISPIALGVCLCTGYIVKNLIPAKTVNRFIPAVVAVEGVAIVAWASGSFTPEVLIGGLVSGLASTGLYEAFSNLVGNAAN